MTELCLLVTLSLLLPSCASALPSPSSQIQLLRNLEQEAARDPASGGAEASRESAGSSFDGPSGFRVQTPAPQSFEDAPADRKTAPRLAPAPEPKGEGNPSYHFVPRKTALPNLTIYRPERDEAGRANSTRPPSNAGYWVANGAVGAGTGALIAGLVTANPVLAAVGAAVAVLGFLARLFRR